MNKRLTLILGGRRAGKSTYAQRLAHERAGAGRVLFVATAEALDDDMSARIQKHRKDRPAEWDTLETPLDIVGELAPVADRYEVVLLDCLTLWVTNLMLAESDFNVLEETSHLLDCYQAGDASWIVVSNEVGLGIVPSTPLGRAFADQLGRVNQQIAANADEVTFIAAGLPLQLKPSPRT
ncbi:MAG: bifunctional adenosylcobinamide kinase/adenosylcobinamide-phosphate guanylyltransferase [Chloroflexi bacterium]|nr:bifunctional adenosylcobinamide kinase/adenosylcobinamide-phosphate guanylyltransferase [Chloroflexota bacterium]MYF22892.1 bifunctional adenosylcobinamide kinase/adenosylcobinamide-phosphate guanylyltransferase [Chloroflexota bacterium]